MYSIVGLKYMQLKSLQVDWNAEPLPDRSSPINSKANEAKSLA